MKKIAIQTIQHKTPKETKTKKKHNQSIIKLWNDSNLHEIGVSKKTRGGTEKKF